MKAKAYLAGPIQHAADHGKGWRERLKDGDIDYEGDIELVDPMDKYNTHEMEYKEWTSEQIVKDDLELIADCDAMLVHWLEVPTCGTPMEVFFSNYFPQVSAAMLDIAAELSEHNDTGSSTKEFFDALKKHEVDVWMRDVMLMAALQEEIPVVVQTRVPPEEISPWLTSHADAMVETFAEAIHWIENEVNGGDAPEPDVLEPEYDLVTA